MVGRGARHLFLLSRSGFQDKHSAFRAEMAAFGAQVEAPPCDVSNAMALENALADCGRRMPPIRGCIQATAVLRVCQLMR